MKPKVVETRASKCQDVLPEYGAGLIEGEEEIDIRN